MRESWEVCEEFPAFAVSNLGRVENLYNHKIIPVRPNREGFYMVTVFDDANDQQYTRSLAILVAKAFIRNPNPQDFNSIIHLNGDRSDCRAMNLMWRSRPFATRYHAMFDTEPYRVSVTIPETGEFFYSLRELCTTYGVVEAMAYADMCNGNPVFPYSWTIERARE